MSLVNIRTGTVGKEVVGIHKVGIGTGGCVIDSVAPSIRAAELQTAHISARRQLQRMICGGGCVFLPPDRAETQERAEEVRIVTASHVHVHTDRSGMLSGWICRISGNGRRN